MKKLSLLLSFIIISICLVGCDATKPNPIMFKVSNPEAITDFPAKVTVDYYISNESNLYSDDTYVVFYYVGGGRYDYTDIFPVEKKENGYFIHNEESKVANYTIPEDKLSEFGYSEVILLDKQNGQFEITVENKAEYDDFRMNTVTGFYDFCKNANCYSDNEDKKSDK